MNKNMTLSQFKLRCHASRVITVQISEHGGIIDPCLPQIIIERKGKPARFYSSNPQRVRWMEAIYIDNPKAHLFTADPFRWVMVM